VWWSCSPARTTSKSPLSGRTRLRPTTPPGRRAVCSAREDVVRRDFTINGHALRPGAPRVIDWVEARKTSAGRVIRANRKSESVSRRKARLLRAVEVAARPIMPSRRRPNAAMVHMAPHPARSAPSAFRDETRTHPHRPERRPRPWRIHARYRPAQAGTAEIGSARPESNNRPQFHPEGDVLEHTCVMLDATSATLRRNWRWRLLHDVGKPQTQTFAERIRFDDHDQAGAEMAL